MGAVVLLDMAVQARLEGSADGSGCWKERI